MIARVVPDVPALGARVFDYDVPEALQHEVRVGSMVRVPLQGRRVGGWVVALGDSATSGRRLLPIAKVTGWGPPADLVALSRWAAWRWAGRPSQFLGTASPPSAVRGLPAPAARAPKRGSIEDAETATLVKDAFAGGPALVRLPPAADPFPVVLAAADPGPALVLSPSVAEAAAMARRLRSVGVPVALMPGDWARAAAGGRTVVGARAAAWAPVPDLAAVVVLDAHDEAYVEERAPTWNARDVALERARRVDAPCAFVSPCPPLDVLPTARVVLPARAVERQGWAALEVVDRRGDDPRTGLYAERLVAVVREARQRGRVLCVLNRKGRARLLVCSSCATPAACERCGAMVEQHEGLLRCRACELERPVVCARCGSTRLKAYRVGVTRVREELEALVGPPVAEVTAESATGRDGLPDADVLVGTEALLHRVTGPVAAVAFLDLDQELLAPRWRAAEEALALLARASRLVGGRTAGGGRLVVQTRLPDHEVVEAVRRADPGLVASGEDARRAALRFPPYAALAVVSGPSAPAFLEAFGRPPGVEVLGPDDDRWLLRAPDHATLCAALAATPRPPGRLRIEVDPLRV